MQVEVLSGRGQNFSAHASRSAWLFLEPPPSPKSWLRHCYSCQDIAIIITITASHGCNYSSPTQLVPRSIRDSYYCYCTGTGTRPEAWLVLNLDTQSSVCIQLYVVCSSVLNMCMQCSACGVPPNPHIPAKPLSED